MPLLWRCINIRRHKPDTGVSVISSCYKKQNKMLNCNDKDQRRYIFSSKITVNVAFLSKQ